MNTNVDLLVRNVIMDKNEVKINVDADETNKQNNIHVIKVVCRFQYMCLQV